MQPHSAGGLVQSAAGGGGISLLRNLYIDNNTRNVKANGTNQFVNNVVYNWGASGGDAYIMGDSAADTHANIQNNYFINGPNTSSSKRAFSRGNLNFHVYAQGNYHDSDKNGALNGRLLAKADYGTVDWLSSPHDFPVVTILSPQEAYDRVVRTVGAPVRDGADSRLIEELSSLGTKGSNIRHEFDAPMTNLFLISNSSRVTGFDSDHDGMPDEWEHAHALNKVAGTSGTNNGVFRVHSSGADIWGSGDAFHFVYQPLSGDGSITARIKSARKTDSFARAGVMMRASTGPDAAYAAVMIAPGEIKNGGKRIFFQLRQQIGAVTESEVGYYFRLPLWMKLSREGEKFAGYWSWDGKTWLSIGKPRSVVIPTEALTGMAVSSAKSGALNEGVFDSVAVGP